MSDPREPALSVLVPIDLTCWNESHLLMSLRSLRRQPFPPTEIWLLPYGGALPGRLHARLQAWESGGGGVHWQHAPEQLSLSEAMNCTLSALRGDWVATLLPGDQLLEPKIQRQMALLKYLDNAAFTICGIQRYRLDAESMGEEWLNSVSIARPHPKANQPVSRLRLPDLLDDCHAGQGPSVSLVCRRQVLMELGGWQGCDWEQMHWHLIVRLLLSDEIGYASAYPDQVRLADTDISSEESLAGLVSGLMLDQELVGKGLQHPDFRRWLLVSLATLKKSKPTAVTSWVRQLRRYPSLWLDRRFLGLQGS